MCLFYYIGGTCSLPAVSYYYNNTHLFLIRSCLDAGFTIIIGLNRKKTVCGVPLRTDGYTSFLNSCLAKEIDNDIFSFFKSTQQNGILHLYQLLDTKYFAVFRWILWGYKGNVISSVAGASNIRLFLLKFLPKALFVINHRKSKKKQKTK